MLNTSMKIMTSHEKRTINSGDTSSNDVTISSCHSTRSSWSGVQKAENSTDEFEDDDSGPASSVDELTTYLTLRVPSEPMIDLLHWWQLNEPALPKMANVARRLLCVPASSSSSENIFSAAGSTVSQRRTALDPESVDSILFVHSNV